VGAERDEHVAGAPVPGPSPAAEPVAAPGLGLVMTGRGGTLGALAAGGGVGVAHVLALHGLAGNRAVSGLVARSPLIQRQGKEPAKPPPTQEELDAVRELMPIIPTSRRWSRSSTPSAPPGTGGGGSSPARCRAGARSRP
jgi:hypothetical protein